MGLTKSVLKRPVTVVMVILCLIVFGLQSVLGSKLELMPSMDMPVLIVYSVYPGASPEDVNDLVSTKIEDEIGSLSGVDTIQSRSMENVSLVIIQYDYGKDIDEAYDDLKKKMDAIEGDLPDDCNAPVIMELNIDEMDTVSLVINNKAESNLYNYVNNKIVPEFEKITTVTDVSISGGQKEYIQVELIPEKLEQYHLTLASVASSIGSADFTYPSGDTIVGGQKLSVSAGTEYDTEELLKTIPLNLGNGNVIYLSDIANVQTAQEDADSIARYNGEDTISIGIKKQQSASAVDVSKSVKQTIKTLMDADENLEIVTVNDTSDNITSSLKSVMQTMVMAVVVSMLIIFLFFGEIKASLIVGTSIPISILAALILIQVMGFSLNVVTLSSLVLGVGMMVDNSIVVLESCFRSTKGKGIVGYREAALEGSGIVLQSIIGGTVTTCVVFLPLALLQGLTGQMFKPLGFTIIFCMVASLISAMTIVPLCYCFYRPQEKEESPVGGLIRAMQNGYRSIMKVLLPKKKTVIFTSIALLVAAFWMASQLRMELMVSDDTGEISVSIETRPGLTLEEEDKIYAQVEKIVTADEDLDSYMLTSGGSGMSSMTSTGATLTAYLKDDRKRETSEVIKEWKPLLNQIAGANISMDIASSSSMSSSSSSGIEYILQSTQYDELKDASDQITKELLERPEVSKVHSTLENAAPVVKLNIDAMKADAENITPLQIAGTVSAMLGGKEATTLNVDGDDVSVMVEYPDDEYDTIDKLKGIVLPNNAGGSVALADVADVVFQDSPNTITRKDKQYQVTITGDVPTDDARQIDAIENKLYNEVVSKHLTPTITRALNSQDESMKEEFGNLGTAIITAIFLIFVVMAAQFESPKFSLMVMTTIPFSLIGSFGLLFLADCPISMVSLLGFLMLVGTVVNNGILYVDTVNQYRTKMDRDTALIEAGATRLRPILMTTLTTVVSMVPMAFAYGDSGKSMQGLALVDVGGLVASTILALLMLPIYYEVMSPKKKPEPHYD
ncbi:MULTISPECIES: efflux RND transporter permease subunit [unclassified Clostridium]|uniref:efflux RND transporter permease subunit n=1 Tax=unclassified Clostridium TaxID=2614128 RepID=UPI000E49FFFE|nr:MULTISPECIES: efflux RND transporter permease subunit [unclassified Clostridium]RHS90965.1 AcrB/AcrD/AcrF family protein [Clostridium sp. AM42-4]RHV90345.1 AcrB/AcrD/AcrF family protein [Clostridium sp. OF09-36]